MSKLAASERKTTISFNDAEETAHVVTSMSRMKKRLEKFAGENPEEVRLIRSDDTSAEYEMPKVWAMRLSRPRKVSDEQRARMAEMARERFGQTKGNEVEDAPHD